MRRILFQAITDSSSTMTRIEAWRNSSDCASSTACTVTSPRSVFGRLPEPRNCPRLPDRGVRFSIQRVMITTLTVRDFALIEHLRLDLSTGLTVVTGETGAGKSIVVDALGLALGERADSAMVRDGARKAIVELEISAEGLEAGKEQIETLGADWQPVLILRREIPAKGVSRCFINDSPAPVSVLREFGDRIVDIHGQHEHQSLLRSETHIGILDSFAGHGGLLAEYADARNKLCEVSRKLSSARLDKERLHARRSEIGGRLKQIDAVDPREGEDDDLERDLKVAEHAERIAALAHELLDVLYDGEGNAADSLGRARRCLSELSSIDSSTAQLAGEIDSATASVGEVARTLRGYAERVEFQPELCEKFRARLASIQELKRRFGSTLPELIDLRKALRRELEGLADIDQTIATLETALRDARVPASAAAAALHESRAQAAYSLSSAVASALAGLGMPNTRFETRLELLPVDADKTDLYVHIESREAAAQENGCDSAAFFISTNLGEDVKPLVKVASGGEVSRIMLALKSVAAGNPRVPVMVFDEIDTGVSGATASAVGRAMKRLAADHQIIAVTHLPQIAACGDAHLLAEKSDDGARTRTTVRMLDRGERIREIARLLSGDVVTDSAIRGAEDLIKQHG